jgi:hypothetical protein
LQYGHTVRGLQEINTTDSDRCIQLCRK